MNQATLLNFLKPPTSQNTKPINGAKKRCQDEPNNIEPVIEKIRKTQDQPTRRFIQQNEDNDQHKLSSDTSSQLESPKQAPIKRKSTAPSSPKTSQPLSNTQEASDEALFKLDCEDLQDIISDSEFAASLETKVVDDLKFDPADITPDLDFKISASQINAFLDHSKSQEPTDTVDEYSHYFHAVPVANGPHSHFWKAFIDAYYGYKSRFKFPSWIDPAKIRDHAGRKADDPQFDICRIKVPTTKTDDDKMHFTPAVAQYWQMKKDYFDRIVFFKLGKFYEIFYTDACILQPLCELKWMSSDEKAHVGFPEMALHAYAKRAVAAGYTVTVIEQMETPQELQQRAKTSIGSAKPRAVHREACEVYSKGTLAHHDMIGPEPNYLCSIFFDSQLLELDESRCFHYDTVLNFKLENTEGSFGYILIDVASSKIFYGYYQDELPARPALKTLLAHTNPSELLVDKRELPEDFKRVVNSLPNLPHLSYTPPTPLLSPEGALIHLADELDYSSDGLSPESVQAAKKESLDYAKRSPAMAQAFLNVCEYLKTLLLYEKMMTLAAIKKWESTGPESSMILDGIALRGLEILEAKSGVKQDSLYGSINSCSTAAGSRLLRRWLSAPLVDPQRISRRQDSVEYLVENPSSMRALRNSLSKLPDMERITARMCSQALQAHRGAVFFTETAQKKIRDFLTLLAHFRSAEDLVSELREELKDDLSKKNCQRTRMHDILLHEEDGGIFPKLEFVIDGLKADIITTDDGKFEPAQGSYECYDSAKDDAEMVKEKLADYLSEELRDYLHLDKSAMSSAKFSHSKFRYEVEVPEKVWQKILQMKSLHNFEVEIASRKSGYTRFLTPEIRQLVAELEECESRVDNLLFPFMQSIFRKFYEKSDYFQLVVTILAEIDVYGAFAYNASTWTNGMMVRCNFVAGETQYVEIQAGYHPILAKKSSGSFTPNDFVTKDDSRMIIITGPNMGGKSTMARQTALLIILAQCGSFVPANSMTIGGPLVDRIFTRIGASDSLMDGKSTFLVELEETLTILRQASNHSLALIDEFGRGTSIEEGSALAYATVRYVAREINCICLFSTHFQDQIAEKVGGDAHVAFYHLACDIDPQNRRVTFLYKFRPGLCPKSHGLAVARMAGIPSQILAE